MSDLCLPAHLGVEYVTDLHAQLGGLLDAEAVTLDASGVERVHAAGLQLLHAFVRDRAKAGHATVLDNPSPTLAQAARTLALASALGIENPTVSGDTA